VIIGGITDNQGNAALLARFATSKYPLFLVLCELAEQMEHLNATVDLAWRRRCENQAADDLTNEEFDKFDPKLRVTKEVPDIEWKVLPGLMAEAEALFLETERNRAAKRAAPPGSRVLKKAKRRRGLKETDPW
jgi:hypothetical protein